MNESDGVLLNVAIQGPAPMRNTAWQIERTRSTRDRAPQCIDDRPLIMDSVFVGLVSERVRRTHSRAGRSSTSFSQAGKPCCFPMGCRRPMGRPTRSSETWSRRGGSAAVLKGWMEEFYLEVHGEEETIGLHHPGHRTEGRVLL